MDLTSLKQKTEVIMDFDDFLQMIKDQYGVTSKEYMIAVFYSPLMPQTFRDNLQFVLMQTVHTEMETDTNYIVINNLEKRADQGTEATVYLNEYKTDGSYGADIIHLPTALVDLVKNYVVKHEIGYGQYLFGKEKLSAFISNMTVPNPGSGYNLLSRVTVNTLRQMRISKICAGKTMTAKDWAKLAAESKHDVNTTGTYIRKIFKWDTDTKVWAEPKPAQPTGPDQSSNPTQFPVPSQENGRMETDADYAPAPPPEDQNNGYMETDVEYGPASPPEGKGAPSDDEI